MGVCKARRILLAAVVVASLAACGDDDDGSAATTTTTTTERATTTSTTTTTAPPVSVDEALAAFSFGEGGAPYAGDCAQTTLEEDVGAWCSTLAEDRGTTRIYEAGPTFSEYTTWLLLVEGPEGWSVEDTASTGQMGDLQPAPW